MLTANEPSIHPSLSAFRAKVFTRDLLKKWIHQRARDIERESSLVDHSLTMLNYAASFLSLQIDQRLHHSLTTLETFLYDLQVIIDL